MDAFEMRMQFLSHLRRLTSASQSINKVVSFLLKNSSPSISSRSRLSRNTVAATTTIHNEADLWECVLEELEKSSINARINIFYMLDSLLDQSLAIGIESYRELVKKDLEKVVNLTVPRATREGILNKMSAMQVLNSWKMRRILPVVQLEALLESLQAAKFTSTDPVSSIQQSQQSRSFSRNDILRRIEDDRERHKRLRERIWVLPVPSIFTISANPKLSTVLATTTSNSPASPASPAQAGEPRLVTLAGYAKESAGNPEAANEEAAAMDDAQESALDVEFEQAWETVGDAYDLRLDIADLEAMEQENERFYGQFESR